MRKNRVIYIILLILAGFNLWISENRGSYTLMYAIVLFALTSLIIVLLSYFSFVINQDLESNSIVKGERATYILKFKNRFAPFCGFKVVFKPVSESIEFELGDIYAELPKKGEYKVNTDVLSKYRGLCPLGVDYVEFNDLLGVFRFRKRLKKDITLMVCPKVVPVSEEIISSIPAEQSGFNYKFHLDDFSEVNDIRKYVVADSIKRIHWKLSARRGELLVKNYAVSHTAVTAVIVDNRRLPKGFNDVIVFEDMVVEAAVSLSNHFLSLNRPVILDYLTQDGKETIYENSAYGFENIYGACCNMVFTDSDIRELLGMFYGLESPVTVIYLVSANPDDTVTSFLEDAVAIGYDVSFIHYYRGQKEDLSLRFNSTGVKYFGFRIERSLEDEEVIPNDVQM
ncbi:MAG: DUF58 domain-containing protein [Clostridiales bacterium]|jgi:hypothetical protein|nr:DUF58 domain-containing protein [Clostridiales bacterium]